MGFCLAYTLCPFDADSQLVTAHAFGLALICGALVGFLCHPDSGGEEALRQRLGVSPSWGKKPLRGYRNDTLRSASGGVLATSVALSHPFTVGSFRNHFARWHERSSTRS